ncbi:polymeric immunoglobulin receptor-like, partial [Clarias magur]
VGSQAYRHFHVKTGTSVTIPCGYDKKYIQYKKYWCSGTYFYNCQIQRRVTVTDNPAESLFTVTMNNLQTGNTGWYWCAVEIDGGPDTGEYLYITVKTDPDLYVKQNNVTGWEGGNVTVQCLYRAAYKKEQKKWCRFKDGSCITLPLQSAVQMHDDLKTTFSVQMTGPKKSDAAWYCCIAGDLQASFHVNVTDPPVSTTVSTTVSMAVSMEVPTAGPMAASTSVTTAVTHQNTSSYKIETQIHWYLVTLLLLLMKLVIIIIIICIIRMKCKAKKKIRTREKCNDITDHTPTFTAEDSIIYSTVMKQPTLTAGASIIYSDVCNPKSSASNVNEDDVIYSSIHFHSKKKT